MRFHRFTGFVFAAVVSAGLLLPALACAQTTGSWNVDNSGLWSNPANWLGGTIADGQDGTAHFDFNITADRLITLDTNRTIGNLLFSDGGASGSSWILSGPGTLTLGVNSGNPVLTTQTQASIAVVLAGSQGMQHGGSATLILTADNIYTGATTNDAAAGLQLGNGGSTGGVAGDIVNNGSLYFNYATGFVKTYSGDISGGGQAQFDSGTTELLGTNTYSGKTSIRNAVLRAVAAGGLSANSNLELDGGVFESNGTFTRALGTGAGQVRWASSGGFSAYGGDLTVDLGGGSAPLVWGQSNFVPAGNTLVFGSPTADSKVTLANALNLAGDIRTIRVDDNAGSSTDRAEISGTITNGGLIKTGAGSLLLTGNNDFRLASTIQQGTLTFRNSQGNIGGIWNVEGSLAQNARLEVDDSSGIGTNGALILGTSQQGTLLVAGGSVLSNTGSATPIGVVAGQQIVGGTAYLGLQAGSSGTAIVTGTGSRWRVNSALIVGRNGQGTLTVTGGGQVTSNFSLVIGQTGGGRLTIADGGIVNSGTALLALTSNLSSTADIWGTGSIWTTNAMYLAGGATSSNGATTGQSLVTVGGGGSLVVSNTLRIWNRGTLTITGGGVTAGNLDRSLGTLNLLSGSLTVSGGLYTHTTGSGGAGNILTINGATALDNPTFVLTGGATVSGVEAVVVGADGAGTLLVSSGAVAGVAGTTGTLGTVAGQSITAGDVHLGLANGSTGTASVWGPGSRLTSGSLYVGNAGRGVLSITDGGQVVSLVGEVGKNLTGSGGVLVSGAGSNWTITNGLFIGGSDISTGGGGTLTVADGGTLDVGEMLKLWNQGTLAITGGGVTAQSFDRSLGTFNLLDGTITVSGGVYTHTSGTGGTGNILTINGATATDNPTFALTNGATVAGIEALLVGSGGQGTLSVSGGAVLAVSGTTGTLATISGKTITRGDIHLGLIGGGTGEATVSGAGSRLTSDALYVGYEGRGVLTITGGGQVVTKFSQVGTNLTGSGSVLVSGIGSNWTVTNSSLIIGHYARGELTVTDGATMTSASTIVGHASTGTATISGTGSHWTTNYLTVGNAGIGTVTITDGAVVDSQAGQVGSLNMGTGTVTVSGPGSQWRITEDLTMADTGTGSLNVLSGGAVTAVNGLLSFDNVTPSTGATSFITVAGAGSRLSFTQGLYLGGNTTTSAGVATMTVGTGGSANVGTTLKLWNLGTLTITGGSVTTQDFDRSRGTFNLLNGSLTVSGGVYTHTSGSGGGGNILTINGSTATDVPTFQLTGGASAVGVEATIAGSNARGDLVVSGGSVLTNTGTVVTLSTVLGTTVRRGSAYLGLGSTGVGTATVSGANSLWNLSNTLYIGYDGSGTLTLTGGGRVTATEAFLGFRDSSNGSVTIDGADSRLSLTGGLNVGHVAAGSLAIGGGGRVETRSGSVGTNTGATGLVVVQGTQSVWTTSQFFVGEYGNATLTIGNGGTVITGSGVIGYRSVGAGTATVTGTGSLWQSTTFINIGSEGTGTLNVLNGGAVTGAGLVIGNQETAIGTLVVSGTQSSVTDSSVLTTGFEGQGSLTVTAGGQITAGSFAIASTTTAVGTMTVSGVGSRIDSGGFSIGSQGDGTLNILDGGLANSGSAYLAQNDATATGQVTVTGANSQWNIQSTLRVGGSIAAAVGTGTLFVGAGGRVDVGTNTTVWSTGTLTVGTGGTISTGSLTGNLTNNGLLVIGGTNTTSTYGGLIGGSGSLQKVGTGTLTFTSAQTYSGGTTISGGTLAVGSNSAGASIAGDVSTAAGTTLQFAITDSISFAGSVGGTGRLVKLNTGTLNLSSAQSYTGGTTVTGGTLRLFGGDDRLATTGTVSLNGGTLNITGTQTVGPLILNSASSSITGSGTLVASTFDVRNGTISAQLGGAGGLQKSTTSTVTIGGGNTYSGGSTILAGTLNIAGDGALGSGALVIGDTSGSNSASLLINGGFTVDRSTTVQAGSGGTIILGGSNTTGTASFTGDVLLSKSVTLTAASGGVVQFLTGTISGSGGITKSGSGTVLLAGSSTYSGGTTISAGVLKLGTNGGIAASTVMNGVSNGLQFAAGADAPTIGGLAGSGGITLQNDGGQAVNLIVGGNNASTTYTGSLAGIGSLTKTGTGTLTLTNNQSYSGGTSIMGGTLIIGGGSSQGNISNTVRNFGVLTFSGTPSGTYLASISGTGSLLMQSFGTRTLNGVQSYTGVTTIASGTLAFVAGTAMTNFASNITNSGALVYDNASLSTVAGLISGTGTFRKADVGTLVLTADNTYSGGTSVDQGTLQIGDGGTSGSLGSGAVVNAGLLVVNRSNRTTLSNAVSGAGGVVQAGPGLTILTGNNSYSGGTTISGGSLAIGTGRTGGSAGGNFVNNGVLLLNRSDTFTVNGVISGTGVLKQIGTGTTVLSGANTFTGGVSILNGTLVLDHTANNTPKLPVGSVVTFGGGRLNLVGNASGDSTQALAQVNLQFGQNEIRIDNGGPGRTATVQAADFTRSAGATFNYASAGGGTSVLSTTIANGSGSGSQAIVGGYALVDNADWAVAAGTNLVGLSTVAAGFTTQNNAGLWAAGQNITSTEARVSGTVAASVAINSLRFDTRSASRFSIAAGKTLDIDSGGILVTDRLSGGSRISISTGTLRGSPAGELIIHQQSTRGGQFLIQSTIADRGGPTGLTKSGPGELLLTNTSTFTGAVVINGGRLTISEPDNSVRNGGQPSALGASSAAASNLVLNGGTLRLPANMTTDRLFTLGPDGGTLETYDSTQTLNLTNTGAVAFSVPDVAVRLVFDGLEGTARVSPQLNDNGTGALSVVKRGSTTVELAGTNSFSGGLTIVKGILNLNYQPFNTAKLAPTSIVTMAGGQLLMSGNAGTEATTFQALGGLVLHSGKSQVTVSSGGVGTAQLSVGAIDRRAGATLTYTTGGFGTSIFETTSTNGSGSGAAALLGGYATFGNNDWAVVDGAGRLVGLSTVTGGYSIQNDVGSWTAGQNITNTGAYVGTLGNDLAINTLRFAVNTTSTISIGDANRLTISSGGILLTGAVNTAQTITGGTLRGSVGGELIINTSAGSHSLTIYSVIADNGGPTGLTKAGFGVVTLANVANTYTGVTWINDFNLSVKSLADGGVASSIGASSADASNLVFSGGRLGYSGSGPASTNRSFTMLDHGATLAVDSAAPLSIGSATAPQAVAFGGTLLGTYELNLEGNSSGTGTLNLIVNDPGPEARTRVTMQAGGMTWVLTGSNSYSGGTSLVSGTLRATNIHAFGTGPILGDTSTGREVEAAGDSNLDFDLDVIAGGGLQLTPDRLTAGSGDGITHSFAYLESGANTLSVIGGDNVTSGTITLSIGRLVLTGSLQINLNDATGGGKTALILGDVEEIKPGFGIRISASGNVILAGDNSYSGATIVSAGTLQVGNGGTIGNLPGNADISFSNLLFNRSDTYAYAGNISGTSGSVQIDGSGTTIFTGTNTYTGATTIAEGTLRAANGSSLPTASNLALAGGVFESSGNLNRALGTGANQMRWTSAGGFSAAGGDLTVNIGGASQALTWGQANFVSTANSLVFGSSTADARTLLVNAIDLAAGVRTVTVYDNVSSTTDYAELSGVLSNGGLSKTGAGKLVLSGDNTYAGGTTVVAGTLRAGHNHALGFGSVTIQSGARLDVAAGTIIDNNLSILAGGSVGGSGTINSNLVVGNGGTVSPGNSPGTMTTASETWAAGGNYLWEMNDVDAGMGTDPGWDWINISNQLNITATSSGKFNVLITSLDLSNAAGPVHDFNPFSNYSWTIATAGGGVNGFDANAFLLDTSGFQNSFSGSFAIALIGNDIRLNYTASAVPEPTSLLLVVAGAGGMIWRRRRRTTGSKPPTSPVSVVETA